MFTADATITANDSATMLRSFGWKSYFIFVVKANVANCFHYLDNINTAIN